MAAIALFSAPGVSHALHPTDGSGGEAGDASIDLVGVVVQKQLNMDVLVASTSLQMVPTRVAAAQPRPEAHLATPAAASTMMLFARPPGPSPAASPATHPVSPPLPKKPVKMDYAMHNGVPMSVLLRVSHKRVLDLQAPAAERRPLAALSDTLQPVDLTLNFVAVGSGGVAETSFTSGGRSPSFDTYLGKLPELESETKIAIAFLGRMQSAADQADSDFAKYTPEAAAFSDHFQSMF